jgi:monooxygenase
MTKEHFDVLIVGAGLSGIGAAYRLQTRCPNKTYAILEGRSAIGGTWDLFRYPGVRSDSDIFTLSYPFRPWQGAKAIVDGPSILRYLRSTADRFGIERNIRYRHKVTAASWNSADSCWHVTARVGDQEERDFTTRFLFLCSGYYNYDGGYLPAFPGLERFEGHTVHPQDWPEDLDYSGRRIVVIGSGATAVTLVPALADRAAHVTMLQRSPTYVITLPDTDKASNLLRRVLPGRLGNDAARWKFVLFSQAFFQLCRRRPEVARRMIKTATTKQLPAGYPVDPDFTPSYEPWDQRMCIVPDGDLFRAIRSGKVDVVTDHISTFTEGGIGLESGGTLDADIVVTATGLRLLAFGGIRLTVDGQAVDPADTVSYRGMMFSGVPNLALSFGYTNASWTLRADLTWRSVARLLNHMDKHGYTKAVPTLEDPGVKLEPFLNLTSGYVLRGSGNLPKQGSRPPWRVRQNYVLDYLTARFANYTESISFSAPPGAARTVLGDGSGGAPGRDSQEEAGAVA